MCVARGDVGARIECVVADPGCGGGEDIVGFAIRIDKEKKSFDVAIVEQQHSSLRNCATGSKMKAASVRCHSVK